MWPDPQETVDFVKFTWWKSLIENFIFCAVFVVDFPVMFLMMENTFDDRFHVAAFSASTY